MGNPSLNPPPPPPTVHWRTHSTLTHTDSTLTHTACHWSRYTVVDKTFKLKATDTTRTHCIHSAVFHTRVKLKYFQRQVQKSSRNRIRSTYNINIYAYNIHTISTTVLVSLNTQLWVIIYLFSFMLILQLHCKTSADRHWNKHCKRKVTAPFKYCNNSCFLRSFTLLFSPAQYLWQIWLLLTACRRCYFLWSTWWYLSLTWKQTKIIATPLPTNQDRNSCNQHRWTS